MQIAEFKSFRKEYEKNQNITLKCNGNFSKIPLRRTSENTKSFIAIFQDLPTV